MLRREGHAAWERTGGPWTHLPPVLPPVFSYYKNPTALFLSLNTSVALGLFSGRDRFAHTLLNISTGNSTLCVLTNTAGLFSYSTSSFVVVVFFFLQCQSVPAGILSRLFTCLSRRYHMQGQSFGSFSAKLGCTPPPRIAAKVI